MMRGFGRKKIVKRPSSATHNGHALVLRGVCLMGMVRFPYFHFLPLISFFVFVLGEVEFQAESVLGLGLWISVIRVQSSGVVSFF